MKHISWVFVVSTVLVAAAFISLLTAFWGVSYNIVIHFDVFRGIDVLDSPARAINAVIFAAFLNIIFIALARFLKSRDLFLAWALALGNAGLMALVLIAAVVIILNN
jgi:hypothetical protein